MHHKSLDQSLIILLEFKIGFEECKSLTKPMMVVGAVKTCDSLQVEASEEKLLSSYLSKWCQPLKPQWDSTIEVMTF